jgi:hypothetical protein
LISFSELSDIFSGTDFNRDDLRRFYRSVKKSIILRQLGKRAWPELFHLEEKCQWPVLKKIDDPDLSIYRGADPELLDRFIRTISEEKDIRKRKSVINKVSYWSRLQVLIEERTDLFSQVFGFCSSDLSHCERVAERYGKILEGKRKENRKKMWQLGVGAGAATLAGAATYWYVSKKERK